MIRLVTWNMDHWRRRAIPKRSAAWQFLRSLNAQYALLQEAVPLDVPKGHCVYREDGIEGKGRWGSAVISFADPVRTVVESRSPYGKSGSTKGFHRTMPGCVAVAEPERGPLLISLYGAFDEGYAVTTVHSLLSDLTPLLDSSTRRGVILAGDLNVSTQWLGPHRVRHRNVMERFTTLGLVNCLVAERSEGARLAGCPCEDAVCQHVQTLYFPRSPVPWQTDYVFVSRSLLPRVRSCRAIDAGERDAWEHSDHRPVVLELE